MVRKFIDRVFGKLSKKADENEKPHLEEVSADELKELEQDRNLIIRCLIIRC